MLVNTKQMVSMTEANQNFSKVTKLVDAGSSVIILKNNKPKYVIIEFSEFEKEAKSIDDKIMDVADTILYDNIKAFKELAK